MKSFITSLLCSAIVTSTFAENLDSASVYFDKAMLEKTAMRYQVASKLLDKAVEFNPKYVDGFINLEMRRKDAAKYAFTKVYELDATNTIAIQQLTELFYSYRQFSKAIEFANKCKNYPNAEKIIGLSSYELEDYPTAVSALQGFLAKGPRDAQAIYTIGRSYLEMEEYKNEEE